MKLIRDLRYLLKISDAHGIARRYFVTNGFDGALTMLGLTMGFKASGSLSLPVAVNACLGAAIALGVSGLTSAYVSESAERKKELRDLEQALVKDLDDTHYGVAARLVPVMIGIVNGAAPFLISLLILAPLILAQHGVAFPLAPLESAIGVAFVCIFLLGVFLGRISGTFWLWTGLRTLTIALVISLIILSLGS